jgi:alpha-mannosidase
VLDTAKAVTREAVSACTDGSSAVTVFNSLSWERKILVSLPDGFEGAENHAGETLPVQNTENGPAVEVVVPSCGCTTVYPVRKGENTRADGNIHAERNLLENEYLRVKLNTRGEIVSIFDKEAGMELTAGTCNRMKMYKDVPTKFDAWDIDSMYTECPVELSGEADIRVVETGPLRVTLRVERQLHHSLMRQDISLEKGRRRVEFHTVIEWRERHKLLKVAFPVQIHSSEALYEIQFGHLSRPPHSSRQFDSDRFEVCHQKWAALAEENRGFALLNDCKYGVNTSGNSINLTLLRAPMGPDENADRGKQEFRYACFVWNGSFAECNVVREAYELNTPVTVTGGAAGEKSFFSVDSPNIVIDTVKPAEDGSGDIIIRLYESIRCACRCTLTAHVPFTRVSQTDMLENLQKDLQHTDKAVPLEFRAFEIKTVRLHG